MRENGDARIMGCRRPGNLNGKSPAFFPTCASILSHIH